MTSAWPLGVVRATFASVAGGSLALLLLCPLTACQHPSASAEPSVTTIAIGPEVLHTGVKRFGINLSGQSFYDSGQMLRNLTFHNPAFEGETWQSILRCKTVTATTCTDENIYTVWPAGFLDGAHYELISGPNAGASGTIRSSSAVSEGQGITLTFANPARPAAPGDFVMVRGEKPGDAQAGWWTNLDGGATLSTEFHDLSPRTPGKQALHVDATAAGQAAAIHSYFDSLEGHSFVQLHGRFSLSFRAKLLSGNHNVAVKVERLDTKHGVHSFFSQTVPLTAEWRDYTFDFTAKETGSSVGTVGLTFTFAGASALLDDVALTAAAAPDNPTAFRDEVVQTLRDLRPGVLRYMDNGTSFGSSLDNMLAAPFARSRAGASTQQTVQEDIPLGLHEFLTLSKAVGAEPWYAMPPGMSPEEAAHLAEYLEGSPATHYGGLRAALGQREPWTTVFPAIHLELGNEQWNHQSFAGATIADPVAYGQRAARVFAAIRGSAGFNPAKFDLILGSWATVPWWTQQEMANSSGFDSVDAAPYLFNDFRDASSPEAVFGPLLAEPEGIDSRPEGYMAQQAKLLQPSSALGAPFFASLSHAVSGSGAKPTPKLAVYEVNLGALSGGANITQADIDRAIPSMGAGLAVADHMLLMLRDLGITTQCLFALPEYLNNFSAPGPKRMIPLWGAVVDMGGATNRRRPQFYAEQLANQAILPTMLATHLTGPPHTWNQPESPNGKVKLDNAHLLQTFAFGDGSRHSLILLNLSRTEAIPVAFSGAIKPTGTVEETILTSGAITDSNEVSQTVAPRRSVVASFNPSKPYALPPFSMTVLGWKQ